MMSRVVDVGLTANFSKLSRQSRSAPANVEAPRLGSLGLAAIFRSRVRVCIPLDDDGA